MQLKRIKDPFSQTVSLTNAMLSYNQNHTESMFVRSYKKYIIIVQGVPPHKYVPINVRPHPPPRGLHTPTGNLTSTFAPPLGLLTAAVC